MKIKNVTCPNCLSNRLWDLLSDYEKAIILMGLTSSISGDFIMVHGSITIPKRF